MALNLHNIVSGPIDSLNPRFAGVWRRSTGYTTASDGTQVPAYADTNVMMRVQALSARDLKHEAFLNSQGEKRSVSLFGNPQGVNKPNVQGGDLLLFPEVRGGPNVVWLCSVVFESWAPDVAGWARVGVVRQV